MITEREAKEKWCPQGRKIYGGKTNDGKWKPVEHVSTFNLVEIMPSPDKKHKREFQRTECVGSQCMAWRWAEKSAIEVPMIGEVGERKGYCGAYGRPEYPDRDD